ncbi:MAG: hypothetical protein LBL42_04450 [Tannerella sp.]|nr:hypothetical protein [Tannerella sp.]
MDVYMENMLTFAAKICGGKEMYDRGLKYGNGLQLFNDLELENSRNILISLSLSLCHRRSRARAHKIISHLQAFQKSFFSVFRGVAGQKPAATRPGAGHHKGGRPEPRHDCRKTVATLAIRDARPCVSAWRFIHTAVSIANCPPVRAKSGRKCFAPSIYRFALITNH